MTPLYPLRFEPIFRRYLWGGRRLGSLLGKQIGSESDYAESWEIVDHGRDQSVVTTGPLAGTTLSQLIQSRGEEVLGRHAPLHAFPLLLKFLDCHHTLSVQVHPNDLQAAQLAPPDLGKTEAWYVLAAEPGSLIYAGLKRGFDRAALERENTRGTVELCLHQIEPQPGDCLLIPAGTIHALGSGLVVAELQQSSDTVYRVHDWNRIGPEGKPRELHIPQALSVIDFARGPIEPQRPQPTDRPNVSRLVACDKFVWDRWELNHAERIGGDNRCHILTVIAGQANFEGDVSGQPVRVGESLLLPAALGAIEVTPLAQATVLDAYLP